MMADARQLLAEALATLDTTSVLDHYEVNKAIEPAGKAAKESGEQVDELRFEFIAVYLALYDQPNVWGTYYGPEMSTPPLESITPECIAYWTARMNVARHPLLRARYADMVWDLSEKAIGTKPPIDAARIAIDGYSEALTKYPEMPLYGWGDIRKRIIYLALSTNDQELLRTAVKANVAYANAGVTEDALLKNAIFHPKSEGEGEHTDGADNEGEERLLSLFEIMKSIPPKHRPEDEFQTIIDVLRSRLEKLNVAETDQFSVERFALPLADYYKSSHQPDEAKTVLRMYGAAVERMAAKTTMAALAVGWLKDLYDLYLRYQMGNEAKHIMKSIEKSQPLVPKDLVPISTTHDISQEEIDQWLNWLVTADVEESFAKLTGYFIPQLDQLRLQLANLKKDYPFSQMFTSTLVDHNGRAVVQIAPDDAEGRLLQHVYQHIQFRSIFLQLGMDHLFEKHSVGSHELFARVIESPVWQEQRHAILRRGIEAHFAGDWIVAVHILVVEIENAVRVIARELGLALQKQNRMGGFDLKNLGDLLADEKVAAFLTEDIVKYLRVVLTDRRGWNLRNDTCHGILPATNFTKAASSQLLHIVLLLSIVPTKTEVVAQAAEQPHEHSG
jgi:hypothetical protein